MKMTFDKFNRAYDRIITEARRVGELLEESSSVMRYSKGFAQLVEKVIESSEKSFHFTWKDLRKLGFAFLDYNAERRKDLYVVKTYADDMQDVATSNKTFDEFFESMREVLLKNDDKAKVLEGDDEEAKDEYKAFIKLQYFFPLKRGAGGLYHKDFEKSGLVILNTRSPDQKGTLYHELIHYVQDVTGKGIVNVEKYSSPSFIPLEMKAKLEKEKIGGYRPSTIQTVLNSTEIITYFNEIAFKLKEKNVSAADALYAINLLIRIANDNSQYTEAQQVTILNGKIKALYKLRMFRSFMSHGCMLCMLLCIDFKQHRTLLKKTIGNYLQRQ